MEKETSYLSIDDIQKQVIPMSKKKIRKFVCQYLPIKRIGRRIYVRREDLDALLADPDREQFPLAAI